MPRRESKLSAKRWGRARKQVSYSSIFCTPLSSRRRSSGVLRSKMTGEMRVASSSSWPVAVKRSPRPTLVARPPPVPVSAAAISGDKPDMRIPPLPRSNRACASCPTCVRYKQVTHLFVHRKNRTLRPGRPGRTTPVECASEETASVRTCSTPTEEVLGLADIISPNSSVICACCKRC